MKKFISVLIVLFSIISIEKPKAQVGVSINFNTFYSDLSPYGTWIDYPGYGRVWSYRHHGFRPYYSDGYWAYTEYGWTWVSDYPWGWATFHYGRWVYTDEYGWIWIPGYEWSPAWVTWGYAGDYYGWAPLAPGWDINVSFYSIPHDRWTFLPRHYMGYHDMYNYYTDYRRSPTIVNNITVVNNYQTVNNVRYHAGPPRTEVERVTNRTITPLAVNNTSTPGRAQVTGNKLNIYKPQVQRTGGVPNNVTQPNQQPAKTTQPVTTQPVTNQQQPRQIQPEQRQPAQKEVLQQMKEQQNQMILQRQEQQKQQQQRQQQVEQERQQQRQQQEQQQRQQQMQQQRQQRDQQQMQQQRQPMQQQRQQQVQPQRQQQMQQRQMPQRPVMQPQQRQVQRPAPPARGKGGDKKDGGG